MKTLKEFLQESKTDEKYDTANMASTKAFEMTKVATRSRDIKAHESAYKLHIIASKLYSKLGGKNMEIEHNKWAKYHAIAISKHEAGIT